MSTTEQNPTTAPDAGARDDSAILDRASLNDIEAILSVTNTSVDEIEHVVKDNADAIFTWDYSLSRPALRKLYEKAKTGQWNATTDLPWDTQVDLEQVVSADQVAIMAGLDPNRYDGTVIEHWTDKEWLAFGIEQRKWTLSQFLHGEQGALICTAKITETVPWYDAKLYASTQVVDEARHVEVFARYLDEKLGGGYQINAHLRMLLDDIVNDSRWDMTYLGMQVMVEGLALAAFGFMHQMTEEVLLKQLLRYVMSDEARHVAFGVLSLKEVYEGMSDAEIKDRQEFAYEAAVRMRDRFLSQEVWERMGVNPRDIVPIVLLDPTRDLFQQMLFSKIVPNCKKLGLLDRNEAWLRRRFEEMGVIQFEDWENTGDEYLKFELGAEAPNPVATV
ncbi:MAG: ferritin-like domain-containing protein [Ilumatobacteraceae bacterium]|nr:MAG: ferritin-like domain-containing protein [Actinomycetota bacterium]